jgi:hypothetical protein
MQTVINAAPEQQFRPVEKQPESALPKLSNLVPK